MKTVFVLLASLFLGFCFLSNFLIPLILIGILVYCWLLFEYSEIALFIAFLMIVNCFSLISEDWLRLPYFFRIRDVFFILSFFPLLKGVYEKDPKIRQVFSNPIVKSIYLILFFTVIQIFITKLRFPDETLNSILRIGRRYLYYAIFFPALYVFLDEDKFKRLVKLLLASVVIFSLLFIIQFFLGANFKIFLGGKVVKQNLQGFLITREYLTGGIAVVLVFQICFMVSLFCDNFKLKSKNFLLMLLAGFQNLLTFGRANLIGIISGITLGVFFARGKCRIKAGIKIFITFILIVLLGWIASQTNFPKKQYLLNAIFSRITSVYQTVVRKEDTLGFRIKDSAGRMELLKKNALIGIGFLHDESKLFSMARGYNKTIRTPDSGIVTLLLDFGVLGLLWLIILTIIVLRESLSIYGKIANDFYKVLILGILSFYLGRVVSFITLIDFVDYDGIVVISLVLALLTKLKYQNQESVQDERTVDNNCKL
jgi:hypothetical protein